MKGLIEKSVIMAMALCVLLSGCGTSVAQLTGEEEDLIVTYAAGAVSKGNRNQAHGLTYLQEEEEEVLTEEEPLEILEEPQDTQEEGTTQQPSTETPQETQVNTVTLTEALNMESVAAVYNGYQISSSYMEGSYFSLNAAAGNTYLILNVGLSNTSEQALECNLLERGIACTLTINGASSVRAMTTILLSDFTTYMGTLEPGTETATVMIFEVPQETADSIETLALELELDGTQYHVDLE